jgi:NADPH2:quinone reductase
VAGPGQVLVRVHAVGVNPVDTYVRAGTYGPRTFPFTPGSDAAGVVESVGAGVTRWHPGDRVYTSRTVTGAYAEKTVAAEADVHPLAQRISFEQGAAIGTACATAYWALAGRAVAQAGETVLVHGASGGVGLAAVQLARASGLVVIGTASTEQGRALVLREGAHHAVDHRAEDEVERVLALTGARGADIVLEMLANENLDRDLRMLARRGRVVVVGSRGRISIDPRDTMSREADVRGMSLLNATPAELARIHAALHASLEAGTLRPVVGAVMPLADAPRAHREILTHPALGKRILVVQPL